MGQFRLSLPGFLILLRGLCVVFLAVFVAGEFPGPVLDAFRCSPPLLGNAEITL